MKVFLDDIYEIEGKDYSICNSNMMILKDK